MTSVPGPVQPAAPTPFVRKPVSSQLPAVLVAAGNLPAAAAWCGGTVTAAADGVIVPTIAGPETAMIGDYIVRTLSGYWPYQGAAFTSAYQPAT